MKKKSPTPLAFHGIVIRTGDPEALARRIAPILGWPVLSRSAAEIVLGAGPELFFILRASRSRGRRTVPNGRDAGVVVEEIHLAVKSIGQSRRRVEQDGMGGDSWSVRLSEKSAPEVKLHVREFRRAPRGKWKKKRPPA